MKINQLKAGSILSYAQMFLGVVIGLVYTPMMIHSLGKSEYGLYNTVSSTISMMSVLSLGFNSSYIRFYSKYKKDKDNDSIYRLNGLYLVIYFIIAAIVMACGIFLTNNLHLVFDEGLTPSEYEIARVLMMLLTVNLSLSFPMSVFSSIIMAHERFVFLKALNIGKTVLGPLVTYPILLMGYRSIAMVLVTVTVSLVVDLCYLFFVLAVLKQKFIIGRVEKGLFWNLFAYTSFIAINLIVDQVNWSVGKFLLGRNRGTEAVAIYSVGYSLYHYYSMFSTAVSNVFTPRIHRIILETKENIALQRQKLTALFTRVGRLQFIILALISTGVLFFGRPFILNIWAEEGYEDSYIVALMLIFSSSIALIQNLGIEIQRAQNRHRFRSIAYTIMALLNLVITQVFSSMYGAIGASFGTAFSLVFANGLIMNIYYHKRCNIDIISFWKSVFSAAKALIVPMFAGVLINVLFDLDNNLVLFAGIAVYSVIYSASMWFFGMNEYEKGLIMKPIKKLLGK